MKLVIYWAVEGVNQQETQVSSFIADMLVKTYTLHVRLSTYNFTPNHQTFTISSILREGNLVPLSAFVDYDVLKWTMVVVVFRQNRIWEQLQVVWTQRSLQCKQSSFQMAKKTRMA